ncbi:Protein of unknown function [Nitrosospira sp. Nl5]|uniref:DUF721 domain-containing protein n=1 Tax=Nitrosospira sp. Nl5 TaxID=200120 RepID=UPI00088383E2|nr:DUF721 domain-containing protein [Nitrosospira sp. Nl5]SCY18417.1 Protein of unknown function [Nitrosospira sp. Nl5]
MTTRKINFFLGALRLTPHHQRLFGHMDELTAMQRVFMEIAPPQLAQCCTLGGFSEGNLTICTHNGAIAAKLRQTLPSLLLRFQAKGYEVTAIRVAVQADYLAITGNSSSTVLPERRRRIGPAGMESLNGLATELPPSPLKTAVESLLKKQKKS